VSVKYTYSLPHSFIIPLSTSLTETRHWARWIFFLVLQQISTLCSSFSAILLFIKYHTFLVLDIDFAKARHFE